jgi:hypothetical protein
MNQNYRKSMVFIAAAVVAGGGSASADTIYDDAGGYNGGAFTMSNGQEVGNEITVTPGSAWSLDSFNIEYNVPAGLSADVGVDVRFYLNDGVLENGFKTPGTVFFDSGWDYNALNSNGAYTLSYNSSDLYSGSLVNLAPGSLLPGDFTFTVTFTNLDSDVMQLPLANSQSTANSTSYGDYWLNNGGNWTLETNSVPSNFVVDMTGTVPEPATFGLAALGGALLFGAKRLRRKN